MSESPSAVGSLKILLPLIPASEKRRFIFLLLLSVVMASAELAITGLVALMAAVFGSPEAVLNSSGLLWLQQVFGLGFLQEPRYLALSCLCAILAAILLKNFLALIHQRHLSTFSETIGSDMRGHLFRFYLRAPYLWVLNAGASELLFGLAASNQLSSILTMALNMFSNLLMISTIFIGLISVSPLPSLLFMLVLGGGGALVVKGLKKVLNSKARATYQADYASHAIQQMGIHGLKEMRLYGREKLLSESYEGRMRDVRVARVSQQTISRVPIYALELLGFGTLVLVLCFLVFAQDAGMARISGIMGFLAAAAWRTLPVANRLVDTMTNVRAQLPYLERTAELVALERSMQADLQPEFAERRGEVSFKKEIRLDDISFSYPKSRQAAVKGVTFTIKSGQMLGLVGLSGAGKSTLVNLLTGLIQPTDGQVLVDGVEITKENAHAWLGHIGYVAQAPYILDASLAENIALSRWGEEIDRERVQECCLMAALDFVDELENGIDTMLGERGTRLSGGQAQRVAIARALYSNPSLIIFDEATSALDMKNEKSIHETILSLRSHVTMVIIAHRLTTVEGCDSIIWMEKGEVYKKGSAIEVLPEYTAALKAEKAQEGQGDTASTV